MAIGNEYGRYVCGCAFGPGDHDRCEDCDYPKANSDRKEILMPRPDLCPNCGSGDVSRHTGSYCEECGEPLTKAEISREHSVAVREREEKLRTKLLAMFALELIYMDGCADQVSGDVESPTGHFYRVGAQIVTTDSQGFKDVNNYTTEAEAEAEFDRLDNEYSEWLGDES